MEKCAVPPATLQVTMSLMRARKGVSPVLCRQPPQDNHAAPNIGPGGGGPVLQGGGGKGRGPGGLLNTPGHAILVGRPWHRRGVSEAFRTPP